MLKFTRRPEIVEVVHFDGSVERAREALELGDFTKVGAIFNHEGVQVSVIRDGVADPVPPGWYIVKRPDGSMFKAVPSKFMEDYVELRNG